MVLPRQRRSAAGVPRQLGADNGERKLHDRRRSAKIPWTWAALVLIVCTGAMLISMSTRSKDRVVETKRHAQKKGDKNHQQSIGNKSPETVKQSLRDRFPKEDTDNDYYYEETKKDEDYDYDYDYKNSGGAHDNEGGEERKEEKEEAEVDEDKSDGSDYYYEK